MMSHDLARTEPASSPPPDEEAILRGLAVIAREELGWTGAVSREMPLVETLGLDSIRQLVLLVAVEDRFRVSFDEQEDAAVQTVGDLVDLVRRKLDDAVPDAR